MTLAQSLRHHLASLTAGMAHIAATGVALILGFVVVLAVLAAVWTLVDALLLTARLLWS